MRQLNNNHFDTNLGATSQVVSSASQPLSVTKIIKDEIMTKADYIKEAQNLEFNFTDEGYCGVNKEGVVVKWGKPCKVEINGKEVIANLWKLPKIWAECCVNSNYFDEWISPKYAEAYHKMYMKEIEAEFGATIKGDK
jgi:hypothetical protein